MKNYSLIYSALFLCAFCVASCAKKGCTDPDSTNYNPSAKKDDGSCMYTADVIFYLDSMAYDSLNSQNHLDMKIYLNSQEVGTVNIGAIDKELKCDDPFSIRETVDMNSGKALNLPYEVKDLSTNELLFKGEKTIQANTCNGIELKY